jgi:hypothetical protein
MGRARSTYGEKRNACRNLVGMPEGRKPLGRTRHRWSDNIKMNVMVLDFVNLAQDREEWRALVITVMKFQVP